MGEANKPTKTQMQNLGSSDEKYYEGNKAMLVQRLVIREVFEGGLSEAVTFKLSPE